MAEGYNAEEEQPLDGVRESDLLSALQERESNAIGNDSDPISQDRATAIAYYLGEPFGNEIEGRSQVVSRDVYDTVEWILPSLLRIFAGGDQVVEFQPEGPEDLQGAQQESDYVDYVIQRKNPWFMIAYQWIKSALLTRNAYAMGYWEDKQEAVLERIKGITDDQLALVGMDQDVQIIAHSAYVATVNTSQGPVPVTLHDVDVRRVKNYGCAKICVLPPERCLVAQDCRDMSVRESSFFEYWDYKTISQLRTEGFNVPDDLADSGGVDRGIVDQARDITNTTILTEQDQNVDPAMRKVKVRMAWLRHDYDGDGIAELRYVVVVGDTFLANQEVTSIPVAAIVPNPMPHRHIGLSLFDAVKDLQELRSAMLRAAVDNQFLANNGRLAVDKNTVNLDDALISRPGGVVRTDGAPANAIMPLVHPNTITGTMQFLDYLDALKQDRTGTQKPMAGADLDALQAQPGTVAQLHSAASQKIELIARVIGEGVKELFQIVHEVILQNPTVQDKVQLRGQWVTVDPREWKKRSNMTLSVGLGVANRQAHVAGIAALLGLQEKALGVGLTSLNKLYNGLSEYTKALGFPTAKQFFDEPPPGAQLPQPQPPYQVIVAQIKAQSDLLVQQLKNHTDESISQLKAEADAAKTYFQEMVDTQNQREERLVRMISEQTERMHEMRLESARTKGEGGGSTIQIAGLDGLSKAAEKAAAAAEKAAEHAKGASDSVAEVKATVTKKKKRTITTDKGKKYTVEEE